MIHFELTFVKDVGSSRLIFFFFLFGCRDSVVTMLFIYIKKTKNKNQITLLWAEFCPFPQIHMLKP